MSGISQNVLVKTDADSSHATPEGILKLGLGFWASKTLLSAIELASSPSSAPAPVIATNCKPVLGCIPAGSARLP